MWVGLFFVSNSQHIKTTDSLILNQCSSGYHKVCGHKLIDNF